MANKNLKNKPLVEAIFEVKWALSTIKPGISIDPYYKILLGRFYDRICGEYPEHEQLPSATFPDEVVGHVVQHRFRINKNDWPLIQIGPGIMTLNETYKYTWTDFKNRAIASLKKLYDCHPKVEEFRIDSLMLRYIDAVDFDSSSENVLDFLKTYLKVDILFPRKLFFENISDRPQFVNLQSSFKCENPRGIVTIRFSTGRRDGRPALLWETIVQSLRKDIPLLPNEFDTWIESAHKITHDWFFILIEGELERRFSGD